MKPYSKLQWTRPSSTICRATGCPKSTLMKLGSFCSNKCYEKTKRKLNVSHKGRRKLFLLNKENRIKCEKIAHKFLEVNLNETNN